MRTGVAALCGLLMLAAERAECRKGAPDAPAARPQGGGTPSVGTLACAGWHPARQGAKRRNLAAGQPPGPLRVFAYGTDHLKLVNQVGPVPPVAAQARASSVQRLSAPGSPQVASVTWSQNAHNAMNYRRERHGRSSALPG